MTAVGLTGGKDTAAAIRIAVAVYKSAGGSGIFKPVPVEISQQLGLTGSDFGMRVHIIRKDVDPTLGRGHIGVKKDHIFIPFGKCHRFVVAFRKAVVSVEHHCLNLRKSVGKESERTVGASVIGYNHFCHRRICGSHHLRKIFVKQLFAIPVQYDYSHTRTGFIIFFLHDRMFVRLQDISSVYVSIARSRDYALW